MSEHKSDWSRFLPQMCLLAQPVVHEPLPDGQAKATIAEGIRRLKPREGSEVAVAVGSRGISGIVDVVRAVVSELAAIGARPFVFPAMGSHGGATAEGQVGVLASLGVTSDSVGCEIRSSMETVQVATTRGGLPVFLDAHAAKADGGMIVINRVKPHTHFRGPTESGLRKMLVIGAGKHDQALQVHAHGVTGLRDLIPEVAQALIDAGLVLGGVGLCEDGAHQTSHVEVIAGVDIPRLEPLLLDRARSMMPRLPVDDLDLLIVDRIGKDISGTGMDTNIVGRVRAIDFAGFESPRIRIVYARSLTEATHGNAIGMGLADLVHQRLADEADPVTTRINAMTGGSPQMGATPIVASTDHAAMEMFDRYLRGPRSTSDLRVVRIRDTLSLDTIGVSEAVVRELEADGAVDLERTPLRPWRYDESGNFPAFPARFDEGELADTSGETT